MRTEEPGVRSSRWRAVETQAVAWLAARRDLLDPRHTQPDRVLFTRKALIETAFLVGLRARLDDAPLTGDYAALLEQVEDVARQPSYREMIPRDEAALLLYAGTYAALRLCGREDLEFRRIIQQAVDGGYAAAFERIPYRQLDLLHTLHVCGIEHDLPTMDEVLPFTLLCRRPNVLKLTDRDVYAITHTIFYVTDFGRREPVWPEGYDPGEGVELVEALLVLAEGRANADLTGELLCCLYSLGVTDACTEDRVWAYLESVQEDSGRVNGPEGVVHPGIDSGDDHYRRWAEAYHTTIVAALAGLLARSPRRRPVTARRNPPTALRLETPLRSAAVWLCEASLAQDPRTGLAGVAAAALGAAAIGEHDLVQPALQYYAARLADADPAFWQEQGMEVVGEFALALRTAEVTCPSLDSFLKAAADAVSSLTTIPVDIADGVHRLHALGFIPASTAGAIPRQNAHREPPHYPLHAALALREALENYHLGQLAATVRTLVHQGHGPHRITQDAIAFLIAQQNTDGAFGHPATDEPAARRRAQYSWTRSAVTALATTVERRDAIATG